MNSRLPASSTLPNAALSIDSVCRSNSSSHATIASRWPDSRRSWSMPTSAISSVDGTHDRKPVFFLIRPICSAVDTGFSTKRRTVRDASRTLLTMSSFHCRRWVSSSAMNASTSPPAVAQNRSTSTAAPAPFAKASSTSLTTARAGRVALPAAGTTPIASIARIPQLITFFVPPGSLQIR
ncbi:hypothetical protein [Burkholderia anthina]|uniref:hypothetical protein n=1 Tax=Burkholderia anthina TaxID=179879 RepID=UPI002445C1BF|nr:hypothetical protein [Burkholderia anthina]